MTLNSALPPRRSPNLKLNNQINITPFVDVMLVLLIVFMVTAPLLSMGVALDLPKTEAAGLTQTEEPLVVSIDAKGIVYLQDTAIADDQLVPRLVAMTGANPDIAIYIRGDQALPYGEVLGTMGQISAAGFSKVVLLANAPE